MQPRVDRHRLTFVLLAWLGGATVCFAQDVARMDQVVQSYVSNGTFAGSVLVARGSDVIVSKGYGLANVEWNVPSSPSARFKVASITKQFTAAAILLLEERGRLKIDDLVKTHLPEAPATWDRITLFHLLTHTAGFPGLQSPPAGRQPPVESADGTVAGFVTALMQRPLESQPGERFNYTNSGYFVLGHLIQKLTGKSYETFLRENIFTPLGMKDSALDSPSVIARRAGSYTYAERSRQRLLCFRSNRSEHGGGLVLDDRRSNAVAERFVRRQGDLEGLAAEDDDAVQGRLRARCVHPNR